MAMATTFTHDSVGVAKPFSARERYEALTPARSASSSIVRPATVRSALIARPSLAAVVALAVMGRNLFVPSHDSKRLGKIHGASFPRCVTNGKDSATLLGVDVNVKLGFGPVIRAARRGQGLTLEEVAERSGVTRRTISDIERGNTKGQERKIRAILGALGISDLLLDGDVEAFITALGPLLQRLGPDERAELMPQIVRLVAQALRPDQELPSLTEADELAAKREARRAPVRGLSAARRTDRAPGGAPREPESDADEPS